MCSNYVNGVDQTTHTTTGDGGYDNYSSGGGMAGGSASYAQSSHQSSSTAEQTDTPHSASTNKHNNNSSSNNITLSNNIMILLVQVCMSFSMRADTAPPQLTLASEDPNNPHTHSYSSTTRRWLRLHTRPSQYTYEPKQFTLHA